MTGGELGHDEAECGLRPIEEAVRVEMIIHPAHPGKGLPQGGGIFRHRPAGGGGWFGLPLDDRTGRPAGRAGGAAALLVRLEPVTAAEDAPQTQHQECRDHAKQYQIDRKTACTHAKLPPRP